MPVNRFGQHTSFEAHKLIRSQSYPRNIDEILQEVEKKVQSKSYGVIRLSSQKVDNDQFLIFQSGSNEYIITIPTGVLHSIAASIAGELVVNGKPVPAAGLPMYIEHGDKIQFRIRTKLIGLVEIELITHQL